MKKKESYAHAGAPLIASAINGLSEHSSRESALKVLEKVRTLYSTRRCEPGEPARDLYEILWIRGFDVTKEERERGYLGNYGRIEYREIEARHLLVMSKVDMALKYHPRRVTTKPRYPMPNWSHPVLRRIKKKGRLYKASEAEAEAELQMLAAGYPDNTVMADKGKLHVQIFSRRDDPKKPVQKWTVKTACDENGQYYLFMERNLYEGPNTTSTEAEEVVIGSVESLNFSKLLLGSDGWSEDRQAKIESVLSRIRDLDFRRLKKLESYPGRRGQVLYHFTSLEGLQGILASGCFWLTDLGFMNDVSEIAHGWACVLDILGREIDSGGELAETAQRISERLDGPDSTRENVYGFSLCEAEEQANQWQIYGRGGEGVALGLRVEPFLNSDCVLLSKVHYHRDQKREKAFRMLRALAEASDSSEEWDAFCVRAFSLLFAYLKHEGYYAEREWRVSCLARSDKPQHRDTSNLKAVPYYEVRATKIEEQGLPGMLQEVVVGPMADQNGERNVSALLRKHGLRNTVVRCSRLPLAAS